MKKNIFIALSSMSFFMHATPLSHYIVGWIAFTAAVGGASNTMCPLPFYDASLTSASGSYTPFAETQCLVLPSSIVPCEANSRYRECFVSRADYEWFNSPSDYDDEPSKAEKEFKRWASYATIFPASKARLKRSKSLSEN